ncbi:MAG: hypothetical protein JWO98_3361, partial [Frankiales bacterium]|nr:hypothetical protein [Frankiales bacterium]
MPTRCNRRNRREVMVSTMSPADAWQRNGMPSDRSYPSGRSPRFDRDREE